MASDPGVEIRGNEVLLVKNGHPVLKVQRGTPFSLVKLLYEADPRNSGCVIGLRPCTDDPLPCFITLDETALSHAKYDVIVHAHGSTNAKNEIPLKQDLGLPKSQLQETAVNTGRSGISPQLVSEGSGQVGTSSCQDLSPSEEHNLHSTAQHTAEHSVSTFNHTRDNPRDAVTEEVHKRSRFQENYLSNSMTVPQRKRPLGSVQASISPSHRRKNARKVFPRKITMMVPNTNQAVSSAGVQVQSYSFYPFMQSSAAQSNQRMEGGITTHSTAENMDSSGGMCDSTAGGHENARVLHENGHFTEDEGDPNSRAADTYRPGLHSTFSAAEADGRVHSWESSSTNESSPAISEEQPTVVDINSENSGTEMEQDGEGVLCESSPAAYHCERTRTNSLRENELSLSAVSLREADDFSREPPETAVVTLENTIQVKTEPTEKSPPTVSVIANELGTSDEGPTDKQKHAPSHASVRNSRKASEQSDRFLAGTGMNSAAEARAEHCRDENNSCNICNKQFETVASLCRHKRTHSGERPFICNICGWGFNLSGNLNQHMAIHQKVKPFRCPYCGKTFARSNVLKAHVRCHTGERPFQCDICGSNFVISHNLKKHLLIRHGIQGNMDRGENTAGSQSQQDGQTL